MLAGVLSKIGVLQGSAREGADGGVHEITRREDHSIDQYQSRLKLSENFERHWSTRISREIHMDQSLVHIFSWGNSCVHGWLFPDTTGEEIVPDNAPPETSLKPSRRASGVPSIGFLYRKNRATTPQGGGKRTRRRGVQSPFLGGVFFVRFPALPSFFPPLHGVLQLRTLFPLTAFKTK